MSSATVRLTESGTAIVFDSIRGTATNKTRGVLLSLEGKNPGTVMNCALIPLDRIGAVIASLELAAKAARD